MEHQAPSGSAAAEQDKNFCVKYIPTHFSDWDLFHIFFKYGTVHNVRIPAKQLQPNSKFAFVTMESLNGADEVRCNLKNGKYLCLENGLQLLVSSVRHGDNQRNRDEGRGQGESRAPLKELRDRNDGTSSRYRDKSSGYRADRARTTVKCYSQDLPLHTATKVHVVDSPYTVKSTKEGFVFHVIPIGQKLSDEYACLQREMNKHCVKSPHLQEMPKIGEYVLYCRGSVAFRALCNSDSTVYLVDMGETVPVNRSQLWEMLSSFAQLPSLVVPCGIAGVTWIDPTTAKFSSWRNALKQWSRAYSDGLTATAREYVGLTNMIQIQAVAEEGDVQDDFASSVLGKDYCVSRESTHHMYSREDLLEARSSEASVTCPPIAMNENVAEIITGLQAVTVA